MQEALQAIAVREKPLPPEVVEFNGKHLEAAFTFRVHQHKQRILEGFGVANQLPALSNGNADVTISESEERFRKSYDLLRREQPVKVPLFNGELSRDYVISVADNLAWKGIENSITTAHLDEIDKAIMQKGANGQSGSNGVAELKGRKKDLKPLALEGNHFYRDFFDSEGAKKLGLDSPAVMRKFLKRASLTGNGSESIVRIARGVSLEIAASRYVAALLRHRGDEATVGFGSPEEDREGGDIVLTHGDKILYIDLKNSRPDGVSSNDAGPGFLLQEDKVRHIYKATVWPESMDAVADDSFRLTDPALKNALQKVSLAIH